MFKLFGKNDSDPKNAEQSQNITKVIVFGALFFVFIAVIYMSESDKVKDKSIGTFEIISEKEAVKTSFMGDVKSEVNLHRREAKELQSDYKKIKDGLDELSELKQEIRELKGIITGNNNKYESFKAQSPDDNFLAGSPRFPQSPRNAISETNSITPMGFNLLNGEKKPTNRFNNAPQLNQKKIINYTPIDDFFGSDIEKNSKNSVNTEAKKVASENIIPSGTILHVSLLSGIDAPTLSKAKRNAIPLLMKVTDLGILPNSFKYDVEDCFILGEGYGDLSSERVYIRTTTLSCITKDGLHIDGSLSGYVAGSDSKNGIRGRVVTKQGAMLARTAVAGFMSGIANGFNMQNQSVATSALGSTTTSAGDLATSDILQMGVFNGASEGSKRLAEFYMDIADELSPVIELSANIQADVIVTEMKEMVTVEHSSNNKVGSPTKTEKGKK